MLAGGLLGTQVLRDPECHAEGAHSVGARLPHRHRDAPVGQHRPVAGQDDRVRLEIAVRHPLFVRELKGRRHVGNDRQRFVRRQLPLPLEARRERLPFDRRRRVVERRVRRPEVMNGHYVRVMQRLGRLHFALEQLGADRFRRLRPHDAEHHVALVLEVEGPVERGPTPRTKVLVQPVSHRDGERDARRLGRHHERRPLVTLARRRPLVWAGNGAGLATAGRGHARKVTGGRRPREGAAA